MNKSALSPQTAKEIAVTSTVTQPSPAVTARIVIPPQDKLRRSWTVDESTMCELMHYAVVKAFEVQSRMGLAVILRGLRAGSLEATTLTPAHRDDEPVRRPRPARPVEVDLYDAVLATLYKLYPHDPFVVQIVVGVAVGGKWGDIQRLDPKKRCTKMLGLLRLNALYRMWLGARAVIMPLLVEVEPRVIEVIDAKVKRRATR